MQQTSSTVVQKVAALLRETTLSTEDRNLLTTVMLDRLGAVPTRARIVLDESGRILVDGTPLSIQKAQRLRRSARTLLSNFARNFVQETVEFLAIKQGVHQNLTPEQGLFAKAILWQHNEERELYAKLAGESFEE